MSQCTIASCLHNVNTRIIDAAQRFGRNPQEIQLVAVSKTKPVSDILQAYDAGQTHFGENYVQEAVEKIKALADKDIEWHFIGSIQGNKAELIAQNFSWVHTIDSVRHAKLLGQYRSNMPPLNVCIQVNINNEPSKSGVFAHEVMDLAHQIKLIPNLKLRGLMAIPKSSNYFEEQCNSAKALHILMRLLTNRGFELDTLSIGMSHDLEAAIAEGATLVRVGTDIFGKRNQEMNDG